MNIFKMNDIVYANGNANDLIKKIFAILDIERKKSIRKHF